MDGGENYTSQYKYEACIKRKNDMEGLYKKRIVGKACIKRKNYMEGLYKKELWERVV